MSPVNSRFGSSISCPGINFPLRGPTIAGAGLPFDLHAFGGTRHQSLSPCPKC